MKNKTTAICLLAFSAMCAATACRAADDPAWYAGFGLGRTDVKKTSSWTQVTDAALLTRGLTSTTLIESHDTAWKLFGGYQFNENFAVEAAYHDLGTFKGITSVTAPAAATVGGKWDAYAGSLSAVGIYPLVKQLSVFGKAGFAVSRVKVDVPAATPYSASATRLQPLLGIGARFDITKAIAVRAEFERFNNVGDGDKTGQSPVNVWTLSAQYRF